MEIEVCEPCEPPIIKRNARICLEENCTTQPIYNFEGESKGIYCKAHRKSQMMNVIDRKCKEANCGKIPNYNFEGETKGIFCKTHAKNGMKNIKAKSCNHEGCTIQSNYNYEGKKCGIFCKIHKLDGMFEVKHKKCEVDGCIIIANYNYENNKTGMFCKLHSHEGMRNINDPKCQKENCNKTSSFNYKGEKKPIFCADHRLNLMINLRARICTEEGCYIQATFNYPKFKFGLYCKEHKKINMESVLAKRCKSEWICDTIVNIKRFNGYCMVCYIRLFPDNQIVKNYKTKETAVNKYIKEQFQNVTWISDKKVLDSCSMKRPDLLLDLGYQVIIIEIDENQHRRYEEICENKRIMELSKDLSHRPIVLIRFNPDEYKNGESKITSCWNYTKKGLMSVKKSKQKEWGERLETLKETVEYWVNNQTEKTIELVYLFYDKTI